MAWRKTARCQEHTGPINRQLGRTGTTPMDGRPATTDETPVRRRRKGPKAS